jgi:putative FmdB family regulatory protein
MPTYDYECDACHHRFEQSQSIKEEALKKCPKCKKSKLRRVFGGGGGILFKGSGFYQTDYRSKNYNESVKKETPSPAPKESPAPAPKKDAKS